MKTKLFSLLLVALLSLGAFAANGKVVDSEVRAALAVLEAKVDVERNHNICRAKAGSHGYKYDFVSYLWMLKNRPYILVSEKIFDGLPNSVVSEIKERWKRSSDELSTLRDRADNNENGKYCSQYFSQVAGGSTLDISVSRTILAPNLGSREDIRVVERNVDMEVGCVKAAYNGGAKQFEGIRKACNCQTALVVNSLSIQEVDEYLALVSENKADDAMKLVSNSVSIPELQACYSSIQAY